MMMGCGPSLPLLSLRAQKKPSGQTLANTLECILGGTGRDSGERSERTHGAESRLGEPRKQNAGVRSARLWVKRGCVGGKEGAEKDRIPSSSSDVAC